MAGTCDRRGIARSAPACGDGRCAAPAARIQSWIDQTSHPAERRASLKRSRNKSLQLAVEHGGNGVDLGIPELTEEGCWLVVLDASLPVCYLVEQDTKRSVQTGPDVVLRHL